MLKCIVCAGNLVMDPSQEYSVCENCGTKYTLDTMKEMSGNSHCKNQKIQKASSIDTIFEDIELLREKGLYDEAKSQTEIVAQKYPADYRSWLYKAEFDYDAICETYKEDCNRCIDDYQAKLVKVNLNLTELKVSPMEGMVSILQTDDGKKTIALDKGAEKQLLDYEEIKRLEIKDIIDERDRYYAKVTSAYAAIENEEERAISEFKKRLENNDMSVIDNFYMKVKGQERESSYVHTYSFFYGNGKCDLIYKELHSKSYAQHTGSTFIFFKFLNGYLIKYYKSLFGGKEKARYKITDIQCKKKDGRVYVSQFRFYNDKESFTCYKFNKFADYKISKEFITDGVASRCKLWTKFPFSD